MSRERLPVVLFSTRAPDANTNPYLIQLVQSLQGRATLEFFTPRKLLLGDYDVLHLHWPEYTFRRDNARFTAWTQLLVALAQLRLRITRKRVVRTLHNLAPHESAGLIEKLLLRGFDASTTCWIRLNPATPARAPRTATILHGDYRDWFAQHPKQESVAGRLLFFGQIRAYKGIEALLGAFVGIDDAALQLHLVGNPINADAIAGIRELAARDARVALMPRHVDDAELCREIGAAEIVVLPYEKMHNSGALLLALSLDRPAIAPRSEATLALRQEVGAGWLALYDAPLTAEKLRACIAEIRDATRAAAPDLSARDWDEAGRKHAQVYCGEPIA